MKMFKNIVLTLVVSLLGFTLIGTGTSAALSPVVIAASASKDAACAGLSEIDTTQDCGTNGAGLTNVVSAVVKILSYVAGVAAVIMVLIAGFKYITSGGDAGKVGSAKTTLIYALIGVGIAAIAQILVHIAVRTAAG